jgi:hypothetical protein
VGDGEGVKSDRGVKLNNMGVKHNTVLNRDVTSWPMKYCSNFQV